MGTTCLSSYAVEEALHRSFGYVIAFILPGLVTLFAVGPLWPGPPDLPLWPCGNELSLTGWIIVLLGSLGVGIILSALRWLLIDTLHHCTGLTAPPLDFALLQDRLDVFLVAVEHNYRFYQFYSNLCVSLLVVIAHHFLQPQSAWPWPAYLGLGALELLLLLASRDCLSRYYQRLAQLLRSRTTIDATDDR